jgi:magnesium chelatase family protein
MFAVIPSATLLGVDGKAVWVEAHVSAGLPGFSVVGLPDTSCRESRDRVRAALLSSGQRWPMRRITVNLAPSGLRKAGSGLDLAIAVALMVADGQLEASSVAGLGFVGELALDGGLRPVPGVLSLVAAIEAPGVVVPPASVQEALALDRHFVQGPSCLKELFSCLRGEARWPVHQPAKSPVALVAGPDLCEVQGQAMGRYALEVAAAGGHNLLLSGPPGAGKTMLARRLPGLLPELDIDEALEVTRIHSAAGLSIPPGGLIRTPPFRAPHHGASPVSLIGGGTAAMRPGEISCSHRGVLFLDELAEFPPAVLDLLRQPLEQGSVLVCRARAAVSFPARFMLVAAMNPCPCGGDGAPGSCRCGQGSLARYSRAVSAPLLDRFDLRVAVHRPQVEALLGAAPTGESSSEVAVRVLAARRIARGRGVSSNSMIDSTQLDRLVPLTGPAKSLLEARLRVGGLSARGLHRVRRVARTIADLSGQGGVVGEVEVLAALDLRAEPAWVTAAC